MTSVSNQDDPIAFVLDLALDENYPDKKEVVPFCLVLKNINGIEMTVALPADESITSAMSGMKCGLENSFPTPDGWQWVVGSIGYYGDVITSTPSGIINYRNAFVFLIKTTNYTR